MIKILAIDDTPDNLISLTAVLKYFLPGCIVLRAESGSKGIEIAIAKQPDTILLDIIMAGMDGFETCRKLKENKTTRHIPVILLTAIKTDSASRVKGLELGADAFLSKPIDEAELTSQVKVMLRIKKAEDLLRKKNKSLEQSVAERTRELILKNEELTKEIIVRKITENRLRASLEEKQVLLKELNHRVKNNMAIISSFLALQTGNLKDEHLKQLLRSSRNRIKSMALVHEQLYKNDNLKEINLAEYVRRLLESLLASFGLSGQKINLELDILPLKLDLNVLIPLGMLINEIISNSLEHAFLGIDKPRLIIRIKEKKSSELRIVIGDNGTMIPAEYSLEDDKTTGMLLIKALAQQLGAEISLNRKQGTEYVLKIMFQKHTAPKIS